MFFFCSYHDRTTMSNILYDRTLRDKPFKRFVIKRFVSRILSTLPVVRIQRLDSAARRAQVTGVGSFAPSRWARMFSM